MPTPAATIIRAGAAVVSLGLVGATSATMLSPMIRHVETQENPLGQVQALQLTTGSGEVHVRAAAAGEPSAAVATAQWGLRKPRTTVSTTGGTAQVSSECRANVVLGDCSVDWEVVVPAGTAVTIEAGAGEVSVEQAGDVEVHLGIGDARLSELSAETVYVEVGVGDVDLDASSRPSDTTVRTGVGDVELTMPGPGPYRVAARSGTGTVTNRLVTAEDADPRIDVETGVGEVLLTPH